MKKLILWTFALSLAFLGTSFAGCLEIDFNDATLCIDIDHNYGDTFELNTDISNESWTPEFKCDILLPDNTLRDVSGNNDCQGDFEYDDNDIGKIKLYIRVNNEYDTLEEMYDFDDYDRTEDEDDDGERWDIEEFEVELEDEEEDPETWTYYEINITAIDDDGNTVEDYDEEIEYEIKVYDGGREDAPSNYYDLDGDQTPYFTSSDDGELIGETEIEFYEEERFRIYVYEKNENDPYWYVTLEVWGDGNDDRWNIEEFEVELDGTDDEAELDEEYDIIIRAIDDDWYTVEDYNEEIEYELDYYDGGYETADSDFYDFNWDQTPEFTSSDDGELDGETQITFQEEWRYKLRIYEKDESSPKGYLVIYVDEYGSSNDSDVYKFEIELDGIDEDEKIDTDQYYEINIKALDEDDNIIEDYDEEIEYDIYYFNNGWKNSSTSYYDFNGDQTPKFTSSDDGELFGETEISFENEKRYKLCAIEKNHSEPYGCVIIDATDDNYDNIDEFDIILENFEESPLIDTYYEIEIYALDNDGRIVEDYDQEIEYEIEIYDNGREDAGSNDYDFNGDETPYFTSSDDGILKNETEIKFEQKGEYKLRVYEKWENDPYGYVIVDVQDWDNNWEIDEFEVEINDGDDTEEDVRYDITVTAVDSDGKTVIDYDEEIEYEIEIYDWWREDASSSSEYDMKWDETPEFSSSDDGEIDGETEIKFKKKERYKVRVYEKGENNPYGYVIVDVGETNTNEDGRFIINLEDGEKSPVIDDRYEIDIRKYDKDGKLDTSYNQEIEYEIKYFSTTRTWKTAPDNFYELKWDKTPTFSYSDDGVLIGETEIIFNMKKEYKLYVYEKWEDEPYGYVLLDVVNEEEESNVDGFTDREMNQIEQVHTIRPGLMLELKNKYWKLKYDNNREDISNDFYIEMWKVLDDDNDKEYDDYDEFFDAFINRYTYTLDAKD